MFDLSSLLSSGGTTILILLLAFLLSLVVIIERWIYFQARKVDANSLLAKLLSGEKLDASEARSPMGYVLGQCLESCPKPDGPNDPLFEEVKSRALAESHLQMERYLNIEATLATVSPYIGLLGTVFGIIQAFTHLGSGATASPEGMSGLNAGIAHALVATAGGLLVAIPATIAYNYFKKRASEIALEIEIAASRLKVALLKKGNDKHD